MSPVVGGPALDFTLDIRNPILGGSITVAKWINIFKTHLLLRVIRIIARNTRSMENSQSIIYYVKNLLIIINSNK